MTCQVLEINRISINRCVKLILIDFQLILSKLQSRHRPCKVGKVISDMTVSYKKLP